MVRQWGRALFHCSGRRDRLQWHCLFFFAFSLKKVASLSLSFFFALKFYNFTHIQKWGSTLEKLKFFFAKSYILYANALLETKVCPKLLSKMAAKQPK